MSFTMGTKIETYNVILNGKILCPGCFGELIVTKATENGEEYYYCRKCKKELNEMEPWNITVDHTPQDGGTTYADRVLRIYGFTIKKSSL